MNEIKVTTYYANDEAQEVHVHFSISNEDFCKLQSEKFYQELVQFINNSKPNSKKKLGKFALERFDSFKDISQEVVDLINSKYEVTALEFQEIIRCIETRGLRQMKF